MKISPPAVDIHHESTHVTLIQSDRVIHTSNQCSILLCIDEQYIASVYLRVIGYDLVEVFSAVVFSNKFLAGIEVGHNHTRCIGRYMIFVENLSIDYKQCWRSRSWWVHMPHPDLHCSSVFALCDGCDVPDSDSCICVRVG